MELSCAPLGSGNAHASHPDSRRQSWGAGCRWSPPEVSPLPPLPPQGPGSFRTCASSGQPCVSRGVRVVSPALQAVSQGLMPPYKQEGVELVGSVAVGCAVVVLGLIGLGFVSQDGRNPV